MPKIIKTLFRIKSNNFLNYNKEESIGLNKILSLFNVKKNFNNFLIYNKEESIGINRIEKYATNNYVIVSPTIQDCIDGNKPKKDKL